MCIKSALFATIAAIGLTAAAVAPVDAQTRTLRNTSGPAEQPPAGFTGRQYVDSKGCVFVRAGVGGNVNWVPRVSRDRKLLCGYSPTRSGAQPRVAAAAKPVGPIRVIERANASTAAAAAPRPAPVAAAPVRRVVAAPARPATPVRTVRAAPVVAPVVAAPRQVVVAPRVQTQPAIFNGGARANGCGASALSARYISGCGAQQPTRRGILRGSTATPPAPVATTRVRVGPSQTPVVRNTVVGASPTGAVTVFNPDARPVQPSRSSGCGASALSARYLQGSSRCGPQAVSPHGGTTTRFNQTTQGVTVAPAGYRQAFVDGRLNPLRGLGNAQGRAEMGQVWTEAPAVFAGQRGRLVLK